MNWAHIHLIVNHFPVVTEVLGLPLYIAALLRKNDGLRNTALGVFIVAGLLVPLAYFTGEPAEDRVGHLPGISEADIQRHEEAAEFAAAIVASQGALAIFAVVLQRRRPGLPGPMAVALLLLSIAGAGAMARTANLGGLIRHVEIRSPGPPAGGDRD